MRSIRYSLALAVLVVCGIAQPAQLAAQDRNDVNLFVRDGQVQQHLFRVLVQNERVTRAMKPRMSLGVHDLSEDVETRFPLEPIYVLPDQEVVETIGAVHGTLMLFKLNDFVGWLQAMERVTPIVTWVKESEDGESEWVMYTTDKPVYLGNLWAAGRYSVLSVLVGVVIAVVLSRKTKGGSLALLRGTEWGLSLSQLQMGVWTLAIGGMVVLFGLIQLEVPEIPASLLALMGLSLATTGVSARFDHKKPSQPSQPSHMRTLHLSQLITVGDTDEISLPKAQMLFWTLLSVVLFLVKSTLDGVLWEVPWQLVVLMGLSQVAYLAPGLFPGQAAPATPGTPTTPTTPGTPTTPATPGTPTAST